MSDVAVVILNYNGKHWLEKFLPSVVAHSQQARIIVADNGSTDDSLSFLEKSFPKVETIAFSENYGFCKGYNEALKQIEARYYVLLNSDVEVTPHWLTGMLEVLESDENIVAVQPKIKSFDDKESFEYAGAAGGLMDKWGYAFCRGRIFNTLEKDNHQYDTPTPIFWATGACICVKADQWHQLGGFDEHFFAHFEEIDWCWRAQNAGKIIYYCPQSEVYHVGGGTLHKSNPRKTFLNYRNNLLTIYKNTSWKTTLWLVPWRLVLDGVSSLLFLKKLELLNIWAIVKAHFSFYGLVFSGKVKKIYPVRKVNFYKRPIIWDYYVRKKKKYIDLQEK